MAAALIDTNINNLAKRVGKEIKTLKSSNIGGGIFDTGRWVTLFQKTFDDSSTADNTVITLYKPYTDYSAIRFYYTASVWYHADPNIYYNNKEYHYYYASPIMDTAYILSCFKKNKNYFIDFDGIPFYLKVISATSFSLQQAHTGSYSNQSDRDTWEEVSYSYLGNVKSGNVMICAAK